MMYMVNDKIAKRRNKIEPWCFCPTSRACLRRFFVDIIAGQTNQFSTWKLEFWGYSSSRIVYRPTAKYFEWLQVFEDTTVVIEWVPAYLQSSVSRWGRQNIPCCPLYIIEWWDDRIGICTKIRPIQQIRHSLRRTNSSIIGIFLVFSKVFCWCTMHVMLMFCSSNCARLGIVLVGLISGQMHEFRGCSSSCTSSSGTDCRLLWGIPSLFLGTVMKWKSVCSCMVVVVHLWGRLSCAGCPF